MPRKERTSRKPRVKSAARSETPRRKVKQEVTPLHERFSEYTSEEIDNIKRDVCLKHKCPYLTRFHGTPPKKVLQGQVYNIVCNYILITGHSRDCTPDVCKHWRDKNVKKQQNLNGSLFNNKLD